MKLNDADESGQHIKKKRHHFAHKAPYSQSYGFSSSHIRMWELDHKKGWTLKNWCFWTVVLEKTLECPLDCKEIQPGHPEGNQSWIFVGRTDVEAETPILWPPDVKSQLIGKDLDAGKDWRQEEKGTTENEMVGMHHWLRQTWSWVDSGSWWCHPTISFSVVPFSSCLQSFPVLGFFLMSQLFASGSQKIGASASNDYSGLISFRIDWFDLLAVQVTLKSLLQHQSSKALVLQCSAFFIVQLSHSHMTTGKTIALTRQAFVGKVMSLFLSFCLGLS